MELSAAISLRPRSFPESVIAGAMLYLFDGLAWCEERPSIASIHGTLLKKNEVTFDGGEDFGRTKGGNASHEPKGRTRKPYEQENNLTI